jgi:hypothetical protein
MGAFLSQNQRPNLDRDRRQRCSPGSRGRRPFSENEAIVHEREGFGAFLVRMVPVIFSSLLLLPVAIGAGLLQMIIEKQLWKPEPPFSSP